MSKTLLITGSTSGLGSTTAHMGLASAVTRHPPILAIELAGLAQVYPVAAGRRSDSATGARNGTPAIEVPRLGCALRLPR